jgi:hypothetical protein
MEEKKQVKVEDTFMFEGSMPPEDMDIDAEAEKLTEMEYDPKKLAWALVELGQRLMGVQLYEYQRAPAYRIFYSMLVQDGAEITLLFSRQSGKSEVVTFCIVMIGVWFPVLAKYFPSLSYLKDGVKMGLFAPQMDQVDTIYGRCMERLTSEKTQLMLADPDIDDGLTSKVHFKLRSGSFLKAQTGAKQSKIESKTYNIAFIDESQDMDSEKVNKSIIPMLAATFGTVIRLGTPNRVKGDFYTTIQHNKNLDRKNKHKDENRLHYEYDYKSVIRYKMEQYKKDGKKFHTLYELSVQRDIAKMGKNSESFRMSYALEWMFEAGMFITEDYLTAKVLDKRSVFPKPDVKHDFIAAGLDIASARASTVLTIGVCSKRPEDAYEDKPVKTVSNWLELSGNYEEQYPQVEQALIAHGVKVLFADYTGVGRPMVDRLMHNLSEFIVIVPYTFGIPTKSEMWKNLDEEIQAGRFIVPAHPSIQKLEEYQNFEEQMLNLQKSWKGPFMVCEKTPGFKDDYCDSAGLFALAGNHLYQDSTVEVWNENIFIKGKDRFGGARW